ncbi:MAG: SOS response-associated peptidase [Candidatus Thorarchaeota archaeon]|jgi:putative SOS response-associated peptidase YedK
MCGRFSLLTYAEKLAERFDVQEVIDRPDPVYNIAPMQMIPTVVQRETRQLVMMKWGLVPSWADDISIGNRLINARAETVATKPSFRAAFKKRRCLILTNGFYEWQKVGKVKKPIHVRLKSREPFAFAGLYEYWDKTKSGKILQTCTIITTTPNDLMKSIHRRMPVILRPEFENKWLNPKNTDVSELESMLQPYPSEEMEAFEISKYVNNPRNQGIECIQPVDDTIQTTLL